LRHAALALACIALAACTPPWIRARQEREALEAEQRWEEFKTRMDGYIGTRSYDETLKALGPPTAVADGDRIRVATWREESESEILSHMGGFITSMPISHGYELKMTFDKQTSLLQSWDYKEW
jgi:hypothetical protein